MRNAIFSPKSDEKIAFFRFGWQILEMNCNLFEEKFRKDSIFDKTHQKHPENCNLFGENSQKDCNWVNSVMETAPFIYLGLAPLGQYPNRTNIRVAIGYLSTSATLN